MPLRLIRSPFTPALWSACRDRFLDQLGRHTGPAGYESFLWLTHRLQRDALFRDAARRGLKGWLAPPIAFLSDLPRLFDVRQRPVSLLRRRATVGRLAAAHGQRFGIAAWFSFDRLGIGHTADQLVGELLPEGVTPDDLAGALARLDGDSFSRRRNEWIVAVYRDYLRELSRDNVYDPRAIHAIVAERIENGDLPAALNGARALHIYGLWTPRARHRLLGALANQRDVDVAVYVLAEEEAGEWDEYAKGAETAGEAGEAGEAEELRPPPAPPAPPAVTPVPDARREFEFIAQQIKHLLGAGKLPPDHIAVIARSGREDTLRAHEILRAAGIPTTARIRSPLAAAPALKAVLQLLRGAATGWTYRALRHVLESAYFDVDLDLRSIDHIAGARRVRGLEAWGAELARLRDSAAKENEVASLRRSGLFADRLTRDCDAFTGFADAVRHLEERRPVAEWIAATARLLDPGLFYFRRRLCDDACGHWETVRLDQQAVLALGAMLREWEEAEEPGDPLGPDEWYARVRRFLASNEIALSNPLKTGVQLLEAHEAALFPFAYTFVVHANDGEFPARPASGGLFTEEERAALSGRLPLATRELSLRRERALWRAVSAGPRVTITYRTADASGVPLLPSLMVPPHDPAAEIPRTRYVWDEPCTLAQARRTVMDRLARAKRGDPRARIAAPDARPLVRGVLAAFAESLRREGRDGRPEGTLGPWSGELRDPWVVRRLGERFGEDRVWSASQLELYGQCPFVFLLQRVLWLDEVAEAEEETTVLTAGSVIHSLLERFYKEYGGPYPAEFDAEVAALFDRVADRVLAAHERGGEEWLGLPPLWELTKRELRANVADYLRWELPELEDRQPHRFELAFGDGDVSPVEIAGADCSGAATRLRLRGRVDRVDASDGRDGLAYHVLDYKSKNLPSKASFQDGSSLQAPLYMRAVSLVLSAPVESGAYHSVKTPGTARVIGWGDEEFERAIAIALTIPALVRAGRFEPRAAKSAAWRDWWPGLAVARATGQFRDGSRFDG